MKPKRIRQHIIGDTAVKIVGAKLPEHWIFRTQGKDYGIDAEIEPVTLDGKVSGKIAKAQIKGHETIAFMDSIYKETGIKIKTANYWLSLNVPVIVFSVDIRKKKVYWVDAAREVRCNFPKEGQKSLSLHINQELDLDKSGTIGILVWKIFSDYNWRNTFSELKIAIERFPEFLRLWEWSHHADCFLPVDQKEERLLKDYHNLIVRLCYAHCVNTEGVKNLSFWYNKAKNKWKMDYELPYAICGEACDNIMPKVLKLLRLSKRIVCNQERIFWSIHDFNFLNTVDEFEIPKSAEESVLLEFMKIKGYFY